MPDYLAGRSGISCALPILADKAKSQPTRDNKMAATTRLNNQGLCFILAFRSIIFAYLTTQAA
jgi:hypothetical protein